MRFLFLSYLFPGPLGAMASWLADNTENQVVFASSRSRQELALANVQRVVLRTYKGVPHDDQDWFGLWEEAIRAGKSARNTLEMVRDSGFDPDMIFCASSNGTAFGLREIFPDSFIVNFLEESAFFSAGQSEMRRCLQYLQIIEANLSFAFNEATMRQFLPPLREYIRLAPMVIDSAFFSPEAAKPLNMPHMRRVSDQLLTVFTHGLTEQELFHVWYGSLQILANNPHCQIVFLLQGGYALKRLRTLKVDAKIADRLFLEAHLRQDILRDLLCASSICLFAGRYMPFGLLESMSCASCPMCAKAPYFLKNAWDMLELQNAHSDEIAARVGKALQDPALLKAIGSRARQTAVANFGADNVMPRFFPEIEKACQEWNA